MAKLIEFDSDKNTKNIQKHKISLEQAQALDWKTIQLSNADPVQYGEQRVIGYGYIGKRLHCIVFTYRGVNVRVISLRKANKRERKKYET